MADTALLSPLQIDKFKILGAAQFPHGLSRRGGLSGLLMSRTDTEESSPLCSGTLVLPE